MKKIKFSLILIIGILISSTACYDELDKTEAFEPFTKLIFSPNDGKFEGETEINVLVEAPGLDMATVKAIGGTEALDVGVLNFSNGKATLVIPVSGLKGASRLDFTANNTDGRQFTTRYPISY
jgi:hypothetical protein